MNFQKPLKHALWRLVKKKKKKKPSFSSIDWNCIRGLKGKKPTDYYNKKRKAIE